MTGENAPATCRLVTVIVPVYNEEKTVQDLIRRVLDAPFEKELLVVDDGSTDGTAAQVESMGDERVRLICSRSNNGKGAAIREAIPYARGKAIVIQDADLEYDPNEIPQVVGPILAGQESIVYGNRFERGFPKGMALPNRVINWILAKLVYALFGYPLHDEATCYKAFRTDLLQGMELTCRRFEFCPEVTAKALRAGEKIKEVSITYTPRSKKAGKKIRWYDGVAAIWTLIKYRFSR